MDKNTTLQRRHGNLVGDSNFTVGVEKKYSRLFFVLDVYHDMIFSRDGAFIYFSCQNLEHGSMLLEEKNDAIILWNNELQAFPLEKGYKALIENLSGSIIVAYLESAEEKAALEEIGAKVVDFYDENYDGDHSNPSYKIK